MGVREQIAEIIKPYLYVPMVSTDDEKYKQELALEVADKITALYSRTERKGK